MEIHKPHAAKTWREFFIEIGTITPRPQPGNPRPRLFRLTEAGRVDCLLDNVPSPNGLVMNLNESMIYLAVTRGNCIWRVPLTKAGINAGVLVHNNDKLISIYGTPYEPGQLVALKISDNVGQDEDEPAVLLISAHHAREITTPVITLAAADRLTMQYATDDLMPASLTPSPSGPEDAVA